MQHIDWERPQRQPLAGLLIAFSKVLWEIAKRAWPFLLLMLFKEKPEGASRVNRYEVITIAIAAIAFTGTLIRYFFFKFYISNNDLIIKKGWIKKQLLVVPLQKVQTVHIEASLLHQLLNVVKVSVDTAGSDKTEIQIDALRRPMAEALRDQLAKKDGRLQAEPLAEAPLPLIRLSGKDLLKLSISANHLEAFFLMLSFGIGLYDNIKDIDLPFLPDADDVTARFTGMLLLLLLVTILITTIIISTIRIFLKYYGLVVFEKEGGFSIRSGLTNIKEKVVAIRKVQAVAWKANWIRKGLGLWLLEYRIAGNDELKKQQKVQVTVTQPALLPQLVNPYSFIPEVAGLEPLRIHTSYIMRRIMLLGLLPALFLILATWYWWEEMSLLLLFLPFLVGVNAALFQRRFRLWGLTDVVYMDRSTWGIEKVLLQWHKVQTVRLKESLFQRRKGLATITLHTASGSFVIPFVALPAARAIVDYALYKIESSSKPWM